MSIFDPIKPTTAVSDENQIMEANRPKNVMYQHPKGRRLSRQELAECRMWGDLGNKKRVDVDGAETHARYLDKART